MRASFSPREQNNAGICRCGLHARFDPGQNVAQLDGATLCPNPRRCPSGPSIRSGTCRVKAWRLTCWRPLRPQRRCDSQRLARSFHRGFTWLRDARFRVLRGRVGTFDSVPPVPNRISPWHALAQACIADKTQPAIRWQPQEWRTGLTCLKRTMTAVRSDAHTEEPRLLMSLPFQAPPAASYRTPGHLSTLASAMNR